MAISVLGALYEKKATGKGRRLQLAMQDSVMHYIRTSFAVMNQQGNKQAAPRMGAQSTSGAPAPCGIYPTKPFGYNDYVYIFCSRANPEHWTRLLKVIGREDLIDDPRFATNEERNKNEDFINEVITEWTKNHTKVEAMQIIVCMMPRFWKLSSFCSSSVSWMAPAGTPAAPMICIASTFVWFFVHSVMTSLMKSSFLLRSSFVAKRGSSIRSSRPITFSNRVQCSGLARLQKM